MFTYVASESKAALAQLDCCSCRNESSTGTAVARVLSTSCIGVRPRSAASSVRGVRVNDEFHSMNNGLSAFPEHHRTQEGFGPRPVAIHVPAWDLKMQLPSDAVALALQVYAMLRGFSWHIRLAPFSFEALLAAMVADDSSTLRDEVHICVLRALAWHDSKLQRQARKLDFARLDATTWPDYLWEYLRYFHCFDWWRQNVVLRPPELSRLDLATGATNPTAEEKRQQQELDLLAGPMPAPDGGGSSEAAWRLYLKRLNTFNTISDEMMMRNYSDLSVTERFSLLNLLCDVLLEQPAVREEVEVRASAGQMHAGAGGEGGPFPMPTEEQIMARKSAEAAGGQVSSSIACVLCTQGEGSLARCDACTALYHARCLGLRATPSTNWLCPECRIGGRGECNGARIPMAAMQPGRITLYLLHGNVLRMPHPGQKYVPEDEDMVDCGLEWLQGDKAMEAMAIAKSKTGQDGSMPSAMDVLTQTCSSAAAGGEAGVVPGHPEQIPEPSCDPWTYSNAYGCAPLSAMRNFCVAPTVVACLSGFCNNLFHTLRDAVCV